MKNQIQQINTCTVYLLNGQLKFQSIKRSYKPRRLIQSTYQFCVWLFCTWIIIYQTLPHSSLLSYIIYKSVNLLQLFHRLLRLALLRFVHHNCDWWYFNRYIVTNLFLIVCDICFRKINLPKGSRKKKSFSQWLLLN